MSSSAPVESECACLPKCKILFDGLYIGVSTLSLTLQGFHVFEGSHFKHMLVRKENIASLQPVLFSQFWPFIYFPLYCILYIPAVCFLYTHGYTLPQQKLSSRYAHPVQKHIISYEYKCPINEIFVFSLSRDSTEHSKLDNVSSGSLFSPLKELIQPFQHFH